MARGPEESAPRRQVLIARREDILKLQEPGIIPSHLLHEVKLDQPVQSELLRAPYVVLDWEHLLSAVVHRRQRTVLDRFVQLMADRDVVFAHVHYQDKDVQSNLAQAEAIREIICSECDPDRVMECTWWQIHVFANALGPQVLHEISDYVFQRDGIASGLQNLNPVDPSKLLNLEAEEGEEEPAGAGTGSSVGFRDDHDPVASQVGRVGAAYILGPWLTQSRDGARLYSQFVWPRMVGRLLQYLSAVSVEFARSELMDDQRLKAWRCVEISPQVNLRRLTDVFNEQLLQQFKPMSSHERKWAKMLGQELELMSSAGVSASDLETGSSPEDLSVAFNADGAEKNERLIRRVFSESRVDDERKLTASASHGSLSKRERRRQHQTGAVETLAWSEIARAGPSGVSYLRSRSPDPTDLEDRTTAQVGRVQTYKTTVQEIELMRSEVAARAKTLDEVNQQMVSLFGRLLALMATWLLLFYIVYMLLQPFLNLFSFDGSSILLFASGALGSMTFVWWSWKREYDDGHGYEQRLQRDVQSLSRRFEQMRESIVGLVEDSHTIGQRQSAIETEKSIQKFARRTWVLIESVFGPTGIATKVKVKPSLSMGQVSSRHEEQVKTYAEQTMVDTLATTDRERDKTMRSLAESIDWNHPPFRLSQKWADLMAELDPRSRGRVPEREFRRRWNEIVMQMKRDFLDQLLVELHQEGETRTRTEMLDEACEKFNRVFHPKDAMTNLSVRLKIDRDYRLIDQQRVSHVHPTQRSSLGRDRYESSKLDVKLRFASRAPYHELFIEEVPFLVSDIYHDQVWKDEA